LFCATDGDADAALEDAAEELEDGVVERRVEVDDDDVVSAGGGDAAGVGWAVESVPMVMVESTVFSRVEVSVEAGGAALGLVSEGTGVSNEPDIRSRRNHGEYAVHIAVSLIFSEVEVKPM